MTATPGQAALRQAVITEVREAAYCDSDDGDQCRKCTRHADAILAAIAAQEPHAAPGPDVCECGHAWAHHAFSDDVCAVAGCPCTRPRPEPKPAPELAEVRRAVIIEILAAFSPSGSGHTARVGMVQIAKWRTRAGLTS